MTEHITTEIPEDIQLILEYLANAYRGSDVQIQSFSARQLVKHLDVCVNAKNAIRVQKDFLMELLTISAHQLDRANDAITDDESREKYQHLQFLFQSVLDWITEILDIAAVHIVEGPFGRILVIS